MCFLKGWYSSIFWITERRKATYTEYIMTNLEHSYGTVTPCWIAQKKTISRIIKIVTESYPEMKAVPSDARGSRDRCTERIKRTITARLPNMYRKINGQFTDFTVRVTDKYQVNRKCNACETNKTFFERSRNVFVPIT